MKWQELLDLKKTLEQESFLTLDVTVQDHSFTLRLLNEDQEAEASKAADLYAQNTDNAGAFVLWRRKYTLAILSHALYKFDNMTHQDLSSVEAEDGSLLAPHEVAQQILSSLSTELRDVLILKYEELSATSEKKAREGVTFLDNDASIRLEALRQEVTELEAQLGLPVTSWEVEETGSPKEIEEQSAYQQAFTPVDVQSTPSSEKIVWTPMPPLEEVEDDGLVEQAAPTIYVDNDGEPLTGVALEAARMQDEQLLQKVTPDQEAARAALQRARKH